VKKKVFTYWNLHRGQWSVKDVTPGSPTYGKVILRMDELLLTDVEGKVSEAGRQRVLREGKKNVHAGLVGYLAADRYRNQTDIECAVEDIGDRISYNPYKYSQFVHTVDESPFEGSYYALLTANRAVFVA
jgi:hypothetical protein